MKIAIYDYKRQSTIAILLIAMTGMMFSTVPYAFANSPTTQGNPNNIVQDSQTNVEIIANNNGNKLRQIYVVEFNPNVTPTVNGLGCPITFSTAPDAAARIWELQLTANGDRMGVNLAASNANSVKIPFGTGVGASFALTSATALSGPGPNTFTHGVNTGTVAGYDGNPIANPTVSWVEITANTPDAPSTTTTGTYRLFVCGDEGGDSNRAWEGSFTVNPPIAGELIPIDMTAVFIAGFMTSPLMMLPVLGMIAGASFVVLKYKVEKKQ